MRIVLLSLPIAIVGGGLLAARLVSVQHQHKVAAERTQPGSSDTVTVGPTATPSAQGFLERLRAISGTAGNDCGTTSASKPAASVSECGIKAFQDHKAFLLGYYTPFGQTVWLASGLASNSAGDVFAVAYDLRGFPAVAPNRRTQLLDNNHIRMTQCIKPVTLDQSGKGLLVCVPPVNREESEKVADQKPVDTTVCAVLDNPAEFNNKLVRIRGHFSGNFEYSMLSADDCEGALWFGYADGEGPSSLAMYVSGGAKPGSEDSPGRVILPIPLKLVRDARLKRFDKQTQAMAKADADYERKHPGEFASHCVMATFIGRIDAVSQEIHEFRKKHQSEGRTDSLGFGQMGLFEAQLVIQSVVDDAILGQCKN